MIHFCLYLLTKHQKMIKASENDETFVLSDVMTGIESDTDRNIDGELEDLREPSVKYFLNDDNTVTASTYPLGCSLRKF